MNIPDEAVAAAARASYPAWRRKAVQAGADVPATFDELPALIKLSFYEEIRPVLEAAVPFIAKQAWAEYPTVDIKPRWCNVEHEVIITWPGPRYLEGH